MTSPITTGRTLRQYAEHFVQRDWAYTRDKGFVDHVRMKGEHFDRKVRWKRALRELYRLRFADWERQLIKHPHSPRWRLAMFWTHVRDHIERPDGVLDGGNIITFWEETGEYIQLMQPSVGSLVADFLEQDPTNPHAIKIAVEIDRIQKDYLDRARSNS